MKRTAIVLAALAFFCAPLSAQKPMQKEASPAKASAAGPNPNPIVQTAHDSPITLIDDPPPESTGRVAKATPTGVTLTMIPALLMDLAHPVDKTKARQIVTANPQLRLTTEILAHTHGACPRPANQAATAKGCSTFTHTLLIRGQTDALPLNDWDSVDVFLAHQVNGKWIPYTRPQIQISTQYVATFGHPNDKWTVTYLPSEQASAVSRAAAPDVSQQMAWVIKRPSYLVTPGSDKTTFRTPANFRIYQIELRDGDSVKTFPFPDGCGGLLITPDPTFQSTANSTPRLPPCWIGKTEH